MANELTRWEGFLKVQALVRYNLSFTDCFLQKADPSKSSAGKNTEKQLTHFQNNIMHGEAAEYCYACPATGGFYTKTMQECNVVSHQLADSFADDQLCGFSLSATSCFCQQPVSRKIGNKMNMNAKTKQRPRMGFVCDELIHELFGLLYLQVTAIESL